MKTCSVPECGYPVTARNWCQAHYMRWYTTGVIGGEVVRRQRGRVCSLDGCDRKHQGRGYCDTHLQRFLKYGDPGPAAIEPRRPGATCSVDGCEKPHQGRGLCDKHLQRLKSTGSATTPLPEHAPGWTGDDATYNAVHFRVRRERGPAKLHTCADCGGQADHWTYDYGDPDPKFDDKGRPYTTDLSHYRPLCKTCHRRFDAERTRTTGCSVAGCESPHKARGMCNRHYRRSLSAR